MTIQNAKPWLIAAWPGMGNVAVLAAGHLVQRLGLKPVGELPAQEHFDIQQVNIRAGVIDTPHFPRNAFFRLPPDASADNPARNLIVFIADAQPARDTYGYARSILDRAAALGAGRVVTFASLASQLHPSQDPGVFGAATDHNTLMDLKRLDVRPLADGQIGGLNGVLLGAAAERNMSGLCLLGELPFFAAGIPNPKAAKAVLETFSVLSGIPADVSGLAKDAETVDRALIQLLEQMQETERKKQQQVEDEADDDDGEDEEYISAEPASPPTRSKETTIDSASRARIERLFADAAADHSKAVALKQELDRLGVFGQFENRFLDLFKRAA